jgi:DNA-directed RNA polymerase beta' subunit
MHKDGYFRADINGCRVDQCCRTVITGDPYLKINEAVCPLYVAQTCSFPIRVNNVNIDYVRTLIKNFPNYPCARSYCTYENDISYRVEHINEQNKDWYANELCVGDIVYRQLLDYDVGLVNRYPCIREESIGSAIFRTRDTKSIQFGMQVLDKMTADFDGDEM